MIISVRDPDILASLDPQQLAIYLQAQGWRQVEQIGNSETVWVILTSKGEEFDITLPLKPNTRSFALRMAEILEILEKVTGCSQLDILSDLITRVPNIEIQGMVIRLADKNHPDNVTIMGFVMGKPRQIHLSLHESEYSSAQIAYQQRLPVVCTGDLIKENGTFVLKSINGFTLDDILTHQVAV